MSTHRHIDRICWAVLALTLALAVLFVNAESLGVRRASAVMGYEETLFDPARVHTIDILMDDWADFTASCTDEEYAACTVVIDNETFRNVAIRAKGNTSLSQVAAYGNDRYSFKIEFDHYDDAHTYHGLDKLALNNIIQDNTYMKDFLAYQLMGAMGVPSPLCSYVYITVNGEDWGLYLAVEAMEESFLQRNYGKDYGELYKPDTMDMGGGGMGGNWDDLPEDVQEAIRNGTWNRGENNTQPAAPAETTPAPTADAAPAEPAPAVPNAQRQNGGMMRGGSDVLLQYTDDDPVSYSAIFDNAKTDITEADQRRLIDALERLSTGQDIPETVDVDAVLRYFVVHNFVLNFDSYTGSIVHNYYLYEQDGQLQMLPWDYNLAFSAFQSAGDAATLVNYPIDTPVSGGSGVEDRPMLAWIFADEHYTDLYHQYFDEFLREYLESGYLTDLLDQTVAMIRPYVQLDPTKFCTTEEFETAVQTLRAFCLLRAQSVRGQLDGTIGSTSNAQQPETLIDAGGLDLSAMGSMAGGMGGGIRPERLPQADAPQVSAPIPAEMPADDPAPAGPAAAPSAFDRGNRPALPAAQAETAALSAADQAVLGCSVLLLVLGLAAAGRYRRRRE